MSQALEWLRLGGPAMFALLGLSIAATTMALVKFWEFWSLQIWRRDFVKPATEALRIGQTDQALLILSASPSPLAEVMRTAVNAQRNPALNESQVRETIDCFAADRLEDLRSLLRPLEVISTLAPLLGLLGTVIGMIEAFQQLQASGDRVDAAVLSGGISQALLTTAAGLIIAIPTVAVLNFLERLVERLHRDMESAVTGLLLARPASWSSAPVSVVSAVDAVAGRR